MILKRLAVPTTFAAALIAGGLISTTHVRAANDNNAEQDQKLKIQIGFQVAPVPLNLTGKDHDLVGLGSYIVNVSADCNGCHTASPTTAYTPTGNPFLLRPVFSGKKQVNPATYLGGGQSFGVFPSPNNNLEIVSRNLTPDITGLPEGGHTYAEFVQIMRTGKDFDPTVHPSCPTGTPQCLSFPFDGSLLQVMPWPAFQSMTDHDLQAIYEYLKAIPCVDTVDPKNPQLHNVCPAH